MPAKPKSAAKPAGVAEYLAALPADRRAEIEVVRREVNRRLPKGYEEGIAYGMIGWCVPHSVYPPGYSCNPKLPLPFAALDSKKGHMSLHFMPAYSSAPLRAWFEEAWAKTGKRLDMGAACIRFRRAEDLALDVIGEAVARMPVAEWIRVCETIAAHGAGARKGKAAPKGKGKGSAAGKAKGKAKSR